MHILGTLCKTLDFTICIFQVLKTLAVKLYYMHILGTQNIRSKTFLYACSRNLKH